MNYITLPWSRSRDIYYLEMVQMWDCKSHPYKLCVMVNNLEILLSTCQTKLTIIRRLTVSVIRSPSFACNPCMFYIFPCFGLLLYLGPLSKNCCCITWNGNTILHKTRRYLWREPKIFWWLSISTSVRRMCLQNLPYLEVLHLFALWYLFLNVRFSDL